MERSAGVRVLRRALPAALCLVVAACGGEDGAGAATLRIGYNPNPQNTTILVAEQQGFFAAHGIDAELTALPNAAAQIPALGKQFDLLTTTAFDVIRGHAQGLRPVVVQGQAAERPGTESTGLMVVPGVRSIADLAGKKVGVPSLAGGLYGSMLVQLHAHGVAKRDVRFVQVPFPTMLDQLRAGRIDAAVTIAPFSTAIEKAGFARLPNPILRTTGGRRTMTAGWAADAGWARRSGATIAGFRRAQEQALAWMRANEPAARQMLVDDLGLPPAAAQRYPLLDYLDLTVAPPALAPWIAPMEGAGLLEPGAVRSADPLVHRAS